MCGGGKLIRELLESPTQGPRPHVWNHRGTSSHLEKLCSAMKRKKRRQLVCCNTIILKMCRTKLFLMNLWNESVCSHHRKTSGLQWESVTTWFFFNFKCLNSLKKESWKILNWSDFCEEFLSLLFLKLTLSTVEQEVEFILFDSTVNFLTFKKISFVLHLLFYSITADVDFQWLSVFLKIESRKFCSSEAKQQK